MPQQPQHHWQAQQILHFISHALGNFVGVVCGRIFSQPCQLQPAGSGGTADGQIEIVVLLLLSEFAE
jgi:hypothetical protein